MQDYGAIRVKESKRLAIRRVVLGRSRRVPTPGAGQESEAFLPLAGADFAPPFADFDSDRPPPPAQGASSPA